MVKFQAVERQNSILVVTSKPQLLRMASTWISRLDKSSVASTGVKVYRVKYGDAKQMAALLANMFTGGGSTGLEFRRQSDRAKRGSYDPKHGGPADRWRKTGNAERKWARAPGQGPGQGQGQGADAAAAISTAGTLGPLGGGGLGGAGGAPLPNVRITADVANNSILVYASEEDYRIIERALIQLDRPRLQVAIDVTIAEVTLNDQLDYGVQFFLDKGAVLNVSQSTLPITPTLPGFQRCAGKCALAAGGHQRVAPVHRRQDFSNPSLVVVDNQPATLEVGDQVPITTGSATVLSANNAVVNTVDYKNTGIILKVQPRINSNGTVLLDIEQEISAVVDNLTNGVPASTTTNLTPTISERRVKSELSVANGQTVLLAGLIQETQNVTHSGIPILDRIPVVGNAFGSKNNSIARTELILFIRPQIIHDGADASVVAEELRSKMRGGQLGSLGLPKLLPEPHRTLQ